MPVWNLKSPTSSCCCSATHLCPTLCNPMDLHYARPPCPSPSPRACLIHVHWVSDAIQPSCPLSSPSPASGSFLTSQLFPSDGQSIGASASTSVLLMNIQYWFPLGFTYLISLLSKGLSRVFSNTKVSILLHSAFFMVQLSHQYMTTRKTIALTRWTFGGKIMCMLFNILSMLVITFIPRSKHLLIWWLESTICSDFGASPLQKKKK